MNLYSDYLRHRHFVVIKRMEIIRFHILSVKPHVLIFAHFLFALASLSLVKRGCTPFCRVIKHAKHIELTRNVVQPQNQRRNKSKPMKKKN